MQQQDVFQPYAAPSAAEAYNGAVSAPMDVAQQAAGTVWASVAVRFFRFFDTQRLQGCSAQVRATSVRRCRSSQQQPVADLVRARRAKRSAGLARQRERLKRPGKCCRSWATSAISCLHMQLPPTPTPRSRVHTPVPSTLSTAPPVREVSRVLQLFTVLIPVLVVRIDLVPIIVALSLSVFVVSVSGLQLPSAPAQDTHARRCRMWPVWRAKVRRSPRRRRP